MRVVLIGDIGWQYLYHLGDEAMTEAAIDMLRERGIDDITLVAGQPAVSEAFYGLPCVTRVGFWGKWSRERNDRHLAKVAEVLEAGEFDEGTTYSAIRDADAVIIAGGGNMNSRDYHLLYERLASKRIAEHFGKPLYVTSQTVGPMLTDEDRARVVEIADYALAFGCREETTTALMKAHVARPELVFHTLDDAVMLDADEAARTSAAEITGDEPFVVASFTWHPGYTWGEYEGYYADVAEICRGIADRHGFNVWLVPHAGSFDDAEPNRDQLSNDRIAEIADHPRVRATRMVTAREDVALIESSRLSLSTRYHPAVFATGTASPALTITPSFYSSVRMRGAMGNVGLERCVLNTSTLHLLADAVAEMSSGSPHVKRGFERARDLGRATQSRWWDALVRAVKSAGAVSYESPRSPESFVPEGAWTEDNEVITPAYRDLATFADRLEDHKNALAAAEDRERQLVDQLATTRATVERYKSRKVIRAIDGLGRNKR